MVVDGLFAHGDCIGNMRVCLLTGSSVHLSWYFNKQYPLRTY